MGGFDAYSCFTRIDRTDGGSITTFDLVKFFKQQISPSTPLDSIVTEFEINMLIKHFDNTYSGSLKFKDFRHAILPREIVK